MILTDVEIISDVIFIDFWMRDNLSKGLILYNQDWWFTIDRFNIIDLVSIYRD